MPSPSIEHDSRVQSKLHQLAATGMCETRAWEREAMKENWINVISGGTFKWDAGILLGQSCLKLGEITY